MSDELLVVLQEMAFEHFAHSKLPCHQDSKRASLGDTFFEGSVFLAHASIPS